MARLVFWEKNIDKAKAEAESMTATIQARSLREMKLGEADAALIGPAPAFFARFSPRGDYRWQLLLLCVDPAAVLRRLTFPLVGVSMSMPSRCYNLSFRFEFSRNSKFRKLLTPILQGEWMA